MNIDQGQFYDFIKQNLRLDKDIDAKKQFLDKQKTGIPSAYELILGIERKYNVKFSGEEISKLQTSKIILKH